MQNRNDARKELIRYASLTHQDIEQIHQCRRDYNRLGFGYQIGVVRFFNRFPTQQPLEIVPDLLTFISVQLQIDENLMFCALESSMPLLIEALMSTTHKHMTV